MDNKLRVEEKMKEKELYTLGCNYSTRKNRALLMLSNIHRVSGTGKRAVTVLALLETGLHDVLSYHPAHA